MSVLILFPLTHTLCIHLCPSSPSTFISWSLILVLAHSLCSQFSGTTCFTTWVTACVKNVVSMVLRGSLRVSRFLSIFQNHASMWIAQCCSQDHLTETKSWPSLECIETRLRQGETKSRSDQFESHILWHIYNKIWNMQIIWISQTDLKVPVSHKNTNMQKKKKPH